MNPVQQTAPTTGKPFASGWAIEALALAAVVVVSSVFYAGQLGTYSDSWVFLAALGEAPDQSWSGLYRALAEVGPHLAVRPVQIAWYILFHKLDPGGTGAAHLAAHGLYLCAILLLHVGLRKIPRLRSGAFAIALIYACMASYTAVRMWYAAHQASIALASFAFSLWLIAAYAAAPRTAPRHWLLVPLAAAAAVTTLSYSLFSFILIVLPLIAWWGQGEGLARLRADRRRLVFAMLALLVPIGAASLYKLSFGYAVDLPGGGEAGALAWLARVAAMYARVGYLLLWLEGPLIVRSVIGIVSGPYFTWLAVGATALCTAVLAGLWKLRGSLLGKAGGKRPDGPDLAVIAGAGIVVLGLAYLPFLLNFFYGREPFGIGDRTNVGGAFGAALVFYALFAWLEARRRALGSALLAGFCLAGVFVQDSIGRIWVDAAREQDRRYEALVAAVGPVSADDTILLSGACPFHGVAPVFLSAWDLRARMHLDPRIAARDADVLNSSARLEPGGLATAFYGRQVHPYRGLVVFDVRRNEATRIDSRQQAQAYFAHHPLSGAAPCAFSEGAGTDIYGI